MIGQTVWIFDGNRRVYRDGQSRPVFREHFKDWKITGETSKFWLLGNSYQIIKATRMLKCPERKGNWYTLSPRVFWSELEVDETCWVHENRYRVVKDVQGCSDANTLRAIDALLAKEKEV